MPALSREPKSLGLGSLSRLLIQSLMVISWLTTRRLLSVFKFSSLVKEAIRWVRSVNFSPWLTFQAELKK